MGHLLEQGIKALIEPPGGALLKDARQPRPVGLLLIVQLGIAIGEGHVPRQIPQEDLVDR